MSFVPPDPDHVASLKKSVEVVGFLHEVLLDPDNDRRTLAGRNRQSACPGWPGKKADMGHVYSFLEKTFPGINEKSKKDLGSELIIVHDNVQRSPSGEETKKRLVRMAQILESQGVDKPRICAELAKICPWSPRWIEKLLGKEYREYMMPTVPKSRINSTSPSPTASFEKKAKKVKRALTGLNEHGLEPTYPFAGCKCRECDNKTLCGY